MSVSTRAEPLGGVPGVATMIFAWRAEGLSELTLETYVGWLARLDRDLPDGLVAATKDQLAL